MRSSSPQKQDITVPANRAQEPTPESRYVSQTTNATHNLSDSHSNEDTCQEENNPSQNLNQEAIKKERASAISSFNNLRTEFIPHTTELGVLQYKIKRCIRKFPDYEEQLDAGLAACHKEELYICQAKVDACIAWAHGFEREMDAKMAYIMRMEKGSSEDDPLVID
jgi:hypothetical protein